MPTLTNNSSSMTGTITITKQNNTHILLDTENTAVEKDIDLTINVQGGSATIPADASITANPTIILYSSTGAITAIVTASKSFTPAVSAGFISEGTAGVVSVNGTRTLQLGTQAAQTITPGTSSVVISAYKFLLGDQTIIGDANLVAGNIANGVSIFGVSGTHTGGGLEDFIGPAFLNITSFNDSNVTSIRSYAFYYNKTLRSVNFPNCTYIDEHAFGECVNLISANFPECLTVSYAAFYNAHALKTINFPKCKYISSNAFYYTGFVSANFPECLTMGSGAFYHNSSLQTISFPKCTHISSRAFASCTSLVSANFPECTIVETSAFLNCSKLTTAIFPACLELDATAFTNCNSLNNIDFSNLPLILSNTFSNLPISQAIFPQCSIIQTQAFYSCYNLTTASFSNCVEIGSSAFYSCSKLTTVSFPNCTEIKTSAFCNCKSLNTVNFPQCTVIYGSAFTNCTSLSTAKFSVCNKISGLAVFRSCTKLISLYLYNTSVCTLNYSTIFSSTPIGGYSDVAGVFGKIYVPSSLVSAYKTATNWTYFSSRIVSI